MEQNERTVVEKKKLNVEVTKEFTSFFKSTKAVSRINLISYKCVDDKERYWKMLIPRWKIKVWEVERDHSLNKNRQLDKKNKIIDRIIEMLREEINDFEVEKLELLKSDVMLVKLYTIGLIDSNWDIISVTPPDDPHDMNNISTFSS